MKKNILITDSLFIFPEHEDILRSNGFELERFDKPAASEDELTDLIKGKHGYILGGIEQVTSKVIEAADVLEAISFTGSGYSEFIPAHREATEKGIAITAAKGGNAEAVAEYTIALILAMVRRLPMFTTPGGLSFFVAQGLSEVVLGVVGFGPVGKKVCQIANQLGIRVLVNTRNRAEVEAAGLVFAELDDVLAASDVVTLHVNKLHGSGILGQEALAKMKDGSILINAAFPHAVDANALHEELANKRILAAFDAPADGDFSDIALGYYVRSNSQTAFNTAEANKKISDRVTASIVNLLSTGEDQDLVNPEYKQYRK